VLHNRLLFWQAGGGEGGERILSAGEQSLCVSHPALSNVRVHDQFHSEAEEPTGTLHDEQCAGKLYNIASKYWIQRISDMCICNLISNLS